ncbi:hypothetical protein nbrc107696_00270 [Gordonia spumicola]|uniref:RNase H type-1 domain-containing protein n=1 Tax=Gordonia spumicola TaxID=589161 RepID=A0A7I9V3I1_9ACTN|nr:RNase H family protein [Gordonia spumicola]GED99580.1 hypothetical protein nbrc107696_00270 [Gordonia spumicola]
MTPIPTARPLAPGIVLPRLLPVHTVHLAVMRSDDAHCRYLAKSGLGTWSAEVATRWPRVAAIDAVHAVRRSIAAEVSIRFVVDIGPPRLKTGHARDLEACFPRVRVESAHRHDHRPLDLVSSALRLWLRRTAQTIAPLTVATDGSVKGAAIGSGWLSETGEFGWSGRVDVGGRLHGHRVMVAELEAVAAAVEANPVRRLALLVDCRPALDDLAAWRNAEPGPGWLLAASPMLRALRSEITADQGRLEFRWVAGHRGVLLNEGADSLSKIARQHAQGQATSSDATRRTAEIAAAFTSSVPVRTAS